MKQAGIYNPYWDSLGGGEKYCACFGEALEKMGYRVDIFWHDTTLLDQIRSRFGISLGNARVDELGYQMITQGTTLTRRALMKDYEVVFWVSDGSVPLMFGGRNILHFQVPFHDVGGRSIFNRLRLRRIDDVVVNSAFTRAVVDREYGVHSTILYPPAEMINPGKKQNIILSVGRFDNLMHTKRQDILIDAFGQMKLPGWELVLAGGMLHGSDQVESLKQQIGSKYIKLVINPTWEELKKYYARASIYWHAAGFGQDLEAHPERAEHFGIATVEAMSAGAVPVVYGGGGQLEIVRPGKNGYVWTSSEELIQFTKTLVQNSTLLEEYRLVTMSDAKQFSRESFVDHVKKIIG